MRDFGLFEVAPLVEIYLCFRSQRENENKIRLIDAFSEIEDCQNKNLISARNVMWSRKYVTSWLDLKISEIMLKIAQNVTQN